MKLTEEQVLDLIDAWHDSDEESWDRPFQQDWAIAEWLEWSKEEYIHWVKTNEIPEQSEESYWRVLNKL